MLNYRWGICCAAAEERYMNSKIKNLPTVIGISGVSAIELLAKKGVNPHETENNNNHGMDALMTAVARDNTQFVGSFLDYFDIYLRKDRMDRTAISIAAARKNVPTLKLVLEYNLKKNRKYPTFMAEAAMDAAEFGSTDCLKLLLKYGADIKTARRYGKTAIELARGNGHVACVALLKDLQ
jgi:ankyrin repeat protein